MKPLAGIRIADFTVHNAGPFCTHMLSQLGAEVVKVESAMRPDAFRKPHPVYGRMGPATFDQVASTKLSIRINLKKPEGIALAKRLVAISDVAAESFRAGVMARLGLGYEALREARPDIVMLSVSSSGRRGRIRTLPATRRCSAPGAACPSSPASPTGRRSRCAMSWTTPSG